MRRIRTLFGIGLALGVLLAAVQAQALSVGVSPGENFATLGDRARSGQMPILLSVPNQKARFCMPGNILLPIRVDI